LKSLTDGFGLGRKVKDKVWISLYEIE